MSIVPFDDRDGVIWYDGALVLWRDARLHLLSHALHYASCVFEGERVYGGQVFKLTEHSQRLIDSGRELGFEVPMTVEEINRATIETVKANGIEDGYVRPLAWRGSEQMGVSAQNTRIHVAVATWTWPQYFSAEAKLKGIRMQMSEWCRPDPRTAPTKSKAAGLYMICTLSKHKAEAAGYDDALMLDWRGRIAEGTGANIFLVIDGKIHTPVPDCILDGITRRTVIGLAQQAGYEVVERPIMPEELAQADEVFLTGTAVEVTPVREIGEYSFTPGTVCKTLIDAFEQEVQKPQPDQAAPAAE